MKLCNVTVQMQIDPISRIVSLSVVAMTTYYSIAIDCDCSHPILSIIFLFLFVSKIKNPKIFSFVYFVCYKNQKSKNIFFVYLVCYKNQKYNFFLFLFVSKIQNPKIFCFYDTYFVGNQHE